jgi:hypothetical protein
MRHTKSRLWFALTALALLSAVHAQAQVLSAALALFPSDTKSVEYDDLGELRKLPNYQKLRQQFTDVRLQQVMRTFRKLGITEALVEEAVFASDGVESYGTIFGTFSGSAAKKSIGWNSLTNIAFRHEQILCPHGATCVWFSEDSTAVFGTQAQLRRLIETREGGVANLSQNKLLTDLLTRGTEGKPMIGAGPGNQLLRWIADSVPQSALSSFGLSKLLSGVSWFSYQVSFPSEDQAFKSHVDMRLVCSSEAEARALSQVINAYKSIQQASASAGLEEKRFDQLSASSSGAEVLVKTELLDLQK